MNDQEIIALFWARQESAISATADKYGRYCHSRAKEIALDDSGCPDSKKIVFTTEELVDGGIKTPYYIIAFNNGETHWTYRINAVSGAILEKSEKTPFISLEKARATLIKAS